MSALKYLFSSSALVFLTISCSHAKSGKHLDLLSESISVDASAEVRAKNTREFLEGYYTNLAKQFPKPRTQSKAQPINVEELYNIQEITPYTAPRIMAAAILIGGEAPLTDRFLKENYDRFTKSGSNGDESTNHKNKKRRLEDPAPLTMDEALIKAELLINMQSEMRPLVVAFHVKRADRDRTEMQHIYVDSSSGRVRKRSIGATEQLDSGQLVRKGLTVEIFQPLPVLIPIEHNTSVKPASLQHGYAEKMERDGETRAFAKRLKSENHYVSRYKLMREHQARIREEVRQKSTYERVDAFNPLAYGIFFFYVPTF